MVVKPIYSEMMNPPIISVANDGTLSQKYGLGFDGFLSTGVDYKIANYSTQ
jgi:hypothetical protein